MEPSVNMTPTGGANPTYTAPDRQYGAATAAVPAPELNAVRSCLTQCINQMGFLKSIHPQIRQLNIMTKQSEIKLTGLRVN